MKLLQPGPRSLRRRLAGTSSEPSLDPSHRGRRLSKVNCADYFEAVIQVSQRDAEDHFVREEEELAGTCEAVPQFRFVQVVQHGARCAALREPT